MTRKITVTALIAFLLTALLFVGNARISAGGSGLVVAGDLPRSGQITAEDMKQFGATDIEWGAGDSKHRYQGIALDKILTHFGFDRGPETPDTPIIDKRAGWRNVVVASAPDGYQAVFTCAEVLESMGATRAFLVWSVDGVPLAESEGPFRIIVTTDREKARCIYNVTRLDIVDMRRVVTPAGTGKTPV